MPIYFSRFERGRIIGGIYVDKKPLKEGLLYRHFKQIEYPAPLIKPREIIKGEAIYAGLLFNHFGHFILESLSRLWYIKFHPDIPIIWKSTESELNRWQNDILKLLRINNPIIIVKRPTVVEKLIIPKPGYIIQNYFDERQCKELGSIKPNEIIKGKKLYITRSGLNKKGGGKFSNELEFENLLMKRGWKIFHPQKSSIQNQLDEISSSEIVLGIEGSAFHSIVFFQEIKTKFFVIVRNNGGNINYSTIAKAKEINYNRLYFKGSNEEGLIDLDIISDILEKSNDFSGSTSELDSYLIRTNEHKIKDSIKHFSQLNTNSHRMDDVYYKLRILLNKQ